MLRAASLEIGNLVLTFGTARAIQKYGRTYVAPDN
jgi:hypothetical protein